MKPMNSPLTLPESDLATAALLLAVDPNGLGGAVWRGPPGPARDDWLSCFSSLLPESAPRVRVPVNVTEDRLLGGLDFASTMATGKPVYATGLLELANDGLLIIAMAERMAPSTCALVNGVLDSGTLAIEREGLTREARSRFAVVALDEGLDDEALDDSMVDRLAFFFEPQGQAPSVVETSAWSAQDIQEARARLDETGIDDAATEQLTRAAAAFGIASVRAVLFAVRAARACAALRNAATADENDLGVAARLVFAHRATQMPAEEPPEQEQEQPDDQDLPDDDSRPQDSLADDVIVDAVKACLPPGLLEMLAQGQIDRRSQSSGSRGGPKVRSKRRGRPIGTRQGELNGGNRLNVLATLKAAAPWQSVRQTGHTGAGQSLRLRKDDIHVNRYEDRKESTTIFAVDASGSQAAQRLAEVKGAIELLLNDCYVRRDQVALIAFRGQHADALLPPTRALARVKRSLRALPGGGGTPLAAGLDAARELALSEARHGRDATIVLLTDGRANINREGQAGAEAAEKDAQESGNLIRANGIRSLLVDTSRRPRPRAQALAKAMNATYVPLPRADAQTISDTVQRTVA